MKKRIISIALLAFSFVFALLLASCGKENERTEVVFIEKPDRYESCEHNWQIKSQALATCVSEGKITMSCTLCRKVNTVSTPKTECEYNTYWKWHNNQTLARLYFDCPCNSAHTYSVDGTYTTTTVEKTCLQRGSVTKVAEVTHNGEKYTDTLIIDKGLGAHNYKTTYELLAFNCEDGLKRTDTCTVCGDVQESIEYSHRLLNEETVYSFDELGLCAGGSITQRVCLCGEMRSDKYTVHNSSCTVTRNENVVHDGTIDYYSITDVCSDCGFTSKFDGAATHSSTDRYMYAYKINTYTLTEDITLTNEAFDNSAHDLFEHKVEYTYNMIDNRWHEQTATCTECLYKHKNQALHSMSYSYEPLGKTCLDGVKASGECRDCGYTNEYVTYNHTTSGVKEIYNLESYGFCQGEIVLEVCYCGYERLAPRGVHWYSQRKDEKKEETDTSVLIKKTERCSKCGFSIETIDERTLIDGAWYKTGIITNIYLDEETTLTSRKDIFKLHSGIPLPDEEIPKAIEELEALLNDASCTLDDDMRRILTYYLEDLKNRQAN